MHAPAYQQYTDYRYKSLLQKEILAPDSWSSAPSREQMLRLAEYQMYHLRGHIFIIPQGLATRAQSIINLDAMSDRNN